MSTALLVSCIAAGLAAVSFVLAALVGRASTPSVPRAERIACDPVLVASAPPVTVQPPMRTPRVPGLSRTSTEFPIEPTVMGPSLFEDVRTDVIAVPPPPPPPRVTLSPVIPLGRGTGPEASLRAATAAIESLCDEGWETTNKITLPPPIPKHRATHPRGAVLPARSLLSVCFDAASTVEAVANALFVEESTAVEEVSNCELPPWLAPTSARFAQ